MCAAFGVCVGLVLAACSVETKTSDPTPAPAASTSPPPSGNTGKTGNAGNSGTGGCSGDVLDCPANTLSADQFKEQCEKLADAIGLPAGTKLVCEDGPNEGANISAAGKETCKPQKPPATCTITGRQIVKCFDAAKGDVCASFDPGAPCRAMLEMITSDKCSGK